MLSERFADPHILAFVRAHEDDKIVARGIVGMEEVCDYAQQAEAALKEAEPILFA